MDNVETSQITCKGCGESKTRYLNGKWDGINKKWLDEAGKAFNGLTCPSCHTNKVRDNMRKLRNNE